MTLNGWILDLYPSPEGMVLWLIEPTQKRHRLIDPSFAPCFYVRGPEAQLRWLDGMLAARGLARCAFVEKRNIWDGQSIPVLEVRVTGRLCLQPQRGSSAALIRACNCSTRI